MCFSFYLYSGILSMLFDTRNERLWFVTMQAERELGDAVESTGLEKQRYLLRRFISRKNVLLQRIHRRQNTGRYKGRYDIDDEDELGGGKKEEGVFSSVKERDVDRRWEVEMVVTV